MIAASLISEDIWSDVPEDTSEAFLYLAAEARRCLMEKLHGEEDGGPFTAHDWRRQYIWELSAIANSLGIDGLPQPAKAEQSAGAMAEFDAYLARLLTSIRVKLRALLRSDSVQLSFTVKADIQSDLENLRATINASNLSDAAKGALHKKVDSVEAELERKRSNMQPFWLLAGALAVASPAIGALADLPNAVETAQKIVNLVHSEKNEEEMGELRRTQPRQLTHDIVRQIEDHSAERLG